MTQILVGYEVSGDPRRAGREISVPLKHTAVLGQTQESGKTTTQEAMITRSSLRAVAFLTKRGEQSFRLSRQIKPFFREAQKEYWRYAASLLEGMLDIKLGFQERGLLIKLCRDYEKTPGGKKKSSYGWEAPTTLSELQNNVKIAVPQLRGSAEIVAMQLEQYLDEVIPEIKRTAFADSLTLRAGINVMDLTRLSTALQGLVIRSVIEWIHQKEKNTIVIIPEAWKFIPEGRNTPVKLATEALIREGGVLKNFVWIDSQDLRGVDKKLMRSVQVWLFGVQREKNEVANTLESIPDLPRPSAADIMRLGKGQFFVAYGNACIKTYVRPAGMEAEQARAIARGEESADSWRAIVKTLDERGEDDETSTDEQGGESAGNISIEETAADSTVGSAQKRNYHGPEAGSSSGRIEDAADTVQHGTAADEQEDEIGEDCEPECLEADAGGDEEMWKEKYDNLKLEFDQLREAHDAMAAKMSSHAVTDGVASAAQQSGSNGAGISTHAPAAADSAGLPMPGLKAAPSLNDMYHYVVARAAKEKPALLRLMVNRPEIEVQIKREVIAMDAKNIKGALAILLHGGFFDSQRPFGAVRNELLRRGMIHDRMPNNQVSQSLNSIVEMGFLTKEPTGDAVEYLAVAGMKVNVVKA